MLPILVPLGTAAVLMLAPKRPVPQRWISLAGSVLLLASALLVFVRVNAAGVQVLQISGWPAPFGITLVADLLAAHPGRRGRCGWRRGLRRRLLRRRSAA